jgi:predicted dehydrogenase
VPDRLQLGIVGAGPVLERYHIPAINAIPEVIRTIIVDADEDRARQAAARHHIPKWSVRLEDLAALSDVALVLVPNGHHASISCALLEKGVHVLCEKPMARTPEECLAMIEAARRGKSLLCIGHNRRFRPHVLLARRLLQKGLIGQIVNVEVAEGSASDWPRSRAYFDREESGGGALLDVGIHSIDLIRWLVGEFRSVEYEGNGTGTAVETEAELRFRLSTGATGKLNVSRTRDLRQRLLLIGSEGYLDIGLWAPTLGMSSPKGKAFQNFSRLEIAVPRRVPLDASFVDQLRNFVSAIQGESQLLVTGEEGLAAVDVVCRAYTGRSGIPAAVRSVPGDK